MSRVFKTMFVVVFGSVTLCHVAGCDHRNVQDLFAALQQGKARGHLVLTTSGVVTAGTQTEFFVGLRGTSLTFDGNIDFADAKFERANREGDAGTEGVEEGAAKPAETEAAGGG